MQERVPNGDAPRLYSFTTFSSFFFFFLRFKHFQSKEFGELKRTIESLPPYNGSDAFSSFFLSSSFLPSFNRKQKIPQRDHTGRHKNSGLLPAGSFLASQLLGLKLLVPFEKFHCLYCLQPIIWSIYCRFL